ncbi:hypothetical protein COY52_10225 [Candidatus Desantisbacteria bacterium CG_4_10_14_0_8_um_filter_48_22]|uniref:Urease accessory protein UreH-like transmembrane domain-containing protein n=1 Tax=Candidatus Desantisbacteria bacterium CG_4_10_14_0_8_um_filter_48_22 TaxID=1974543 RepID=A0A2M7S716_9BACT|nr:MAG: hypothetical protein COS16_01555 [Candidatus Desantisbacteria bacterium CG02_land_8_20_14_3_00_49_13]PIZ15208.1 MAG: hypothetical protein COY52_10225 [Candidatus Desantisbacteria bacterium CG_4_10_14_0_8_um_filter_48_22]PJB28422.1 MAG: hypothetical protein CO111_01670 [Candidatus Desantisbacteria bacterium CG_4_9_14_3_um_filter_50_7]
MKSELGKLFLTGLTMGWGPCMGVCLPVILPYIAGAEKGWKKGFLASLAFSVSRFTAYVILGFLAGFAAKMLLRGFYQHNIGLYINKVGAAIIILFGVLIILGKNFQSPFCRILREHTIEKGMRGTIILGFLTGLSPCAPLMGALAMIILEAKNGLQGMAFGAAFGLGTMLSPVLLFGTLAGGASSYLLKFKRASDIAGRACGALLALWGVLILLR